MNPRNTAWAREAMLAERVLPDYSWPARVPIEVLARDIQRETREATAMAARLFPHWLRQAERVAS